MNLDNRTLALIAVGASVSANCQPCLERNVKAALKCGASTQQIAEAIEIGKRVRQGTASKMDKFIMGLCESASVSGIGAEAGCSCGL